MFIAGLESNLELLKHYLLQSTSVATFGVIAPVVLIYFLGRIFNFNNEEAVFLGVTFAATSVSISVEVLKELGKLNSKEGTTILGAAVIDDIMAIVILSVLVSVFSDVGQTQSSNTLSGGNIWVGFGLQFVYFIFIYLAFKLLVPVLMKISTKIQSTSPVVLMAVVISLGMAYLASLFGLSAVLGSFFAGIAIGQTPYKQQIDTEIEPIGYAVFIPVFLLV
ncbi:Na+/H+ antiporter [Secundilactobacillus mixtipabuli]|uniref:Na+/H+ antiporter n=1 Tax=Secundilactobacillus mixtipabuli TaxID=1435342 RepID=A0A1Z5I9V4_9LACO|nr:Na+/H+ antiporter [Secundilactobacillus mixtipabuli]